MYYFKDIRGTKLNTDLNNTMNRLYKFYEDDDRFELEASYNSIDFLVKGELAFDVNTETMHHIEYEFNSYQEHLDEASGDLDDIKDAEALLSIANKIDEDFGKINYSGQFVTDLEDFAFVKGKKIVEYLNSML